MRKNFPSCLRDKEYIPESSLETKMAFMGRHIEVSAQGYRIRFDKAISYVYLLIMYM
jgi:hypothetical protein